MIFNEPAYFLVLAIAAVAFRYLPGSAKPWWLFGMGLLFYAYFSPAFVAILLAETLLVYALGWAIRYRPTARTLAFAAGLVVTVGMLVVYKYSGLLLTTASAAGVRGLPSFEQLRLPLAISFFTFEFVHYLADARSGRLPDHGSADFLGFAMFVPTMVAGPIKRFQGFSTQVREAQATPRDVHEGVTRVLIGLLKKVVIADTLTLWIAPLASSDGLAVATRTEIVVALVAYSIRIYMDFSGYSDIAIGSARLFGLRVPENFSWPYLRTNIADFWRSWHISLTSWIRDYVYIPLGGSRCSTARQYGNVLVAFAVSGIWHGAAWNFLGWGLYHGSLLAVHRMWSDGVRPRLAFLPKRDAAPSALGSRLAAGAGAIAGGVLTFSLVTIGWGLFAMPFGRFVTMLERLVTGGF